MQDVSRNDKKFCEDLHTGIDIRRKPKFGRRNSNVSGALFSIAAFNDIYAYDSNGEKWSLVMCDVNITGPLIDIDNYWISFALYFDE
ncbi:hypothetical protein V1477_020497 [Vespula maculifrons]|uniref:Uncharacterized protein n=1 Tax=Vespula maculifrons TaxID=7453 RepID=A0ABD2AM44_VESMC